MHVSYDMKTNVFILVISIPAHFQEINKMAHNHAMVLNKKHLYR